MSGTGRQIHSATQECEREMDELQKEKVDLGLEKRRQELKLGNITNLIRTSGLMPADKYKQCVASQTKYREAIFAIELRLGAIKKRSTEIHRFMEDNGNLQDGENHVNPSQKRDVVQSLVAMREDYTNFAADSTRVSSMRQMAAEFVVKLDRVIKTAVNAQ